MLNKLDDQTQVPILRGCFINISQMSSSEDGANEKQENKYEDFSINAVLSESIFGLLFSPTTPILFDSTGILSALSQTYDINGLMNKEQTNKKSDEKVLSESHDSVSQVDIKSNVKEPEKGEMLYDMNLSVPLDKNKEKLTRMIKSNWDPSLHRLGCFELNDPSDKKNPKKNVKSKIFCNNFRFNLGEEFEAK